MKQRIFLLLVLSIIATGVAAQEPMGFDTLQVMDYENPKEYVIADVTVSGIEFIQKEVLVSLSGLKKGNTITLPGDEELLFPACAPAKNQTVVVVPAE